MDKYEILYTTSQCLLHEFGHEKIVIRNCFRFTTYIRIAFLNYFSLQKRAYDTLSFKRLLGAK